MQWALTTGDPLADAVAQDMHTDNRAANQRVHDSLRAGLAGGLSSLSNPPPSVAALLADAERTADYVDDALLDKGSDAFHSMPGPAHIVSLSAGALIRVYESPSIAAVLSSTGRLVEGAETRIRETGKWLISVMLPGALRVGQPGYIATLQVRMLHAHMRRAVCARGFDEAAYGAAINQVDLARTWLDFTLTSWRAEDAMGFGLTSREIATLYRYWWHVGHLLGIDARLIEGIASHQQASRIDELLQAVTGPLVPESAALAGATIRSISAELRIALNLPETLGSKGLGSLARKFHGDAISDELLIARSPATDKVINTAIGVIRNRRAKLRKDPEGWGKMKARNLVAIRGQMAERDDPAQYEEAAE